MSTIDDDPASPSPAPGYPDVLRILQLVGDLPEVHACAPARPGVFVEEGRLRMQVPLDVRDERLFLMYTLASDDTPVDVALFVHKHVQHVQKGGDPAAPPSTWI